MRKRKMMKIKNVKMNNKFKLYFPIYIIFINILLNFIFCATDKKDCNLGRTIQLIIDGKLSEQKIDSCFKNLELVNIKTQKDTICTNLEVGFLYFGEGKLQTAENIFNKVLILDSSNTWAFLGIGWIINQQGDNHKALINLNKSIMYNNKNSWAYCIRSSIKFELGFEKGAIADLRHASDLNPGYHKILNSLAIYYYGKNQLDSALYYTDIAAMNGRLEPDIFLLRSIIKQAKGDIKNSIIDLSKYLDITPSDTLRIIERAKMYEKIADYQSAIFDYKRILKISRYHNYFHYDIAANYAQLNNFDSTLKYIRLIEEDSQLNSKYYKTKIKEDKRFKNFISNKELNKIFQP